MTATASLCCAYLSSASSATPNLSIHPGLPLSHTIPVFPTIRLASQPLVFILDKLSDVEYRLASGTSEKLNLGALVGAFKVMAELTVQSASDRPEK